jgi:hypothetical protein
VHGSVPAQQANVSSEQQIEQHVHKWPSWVGGTVFCLMLVLILVLLYNVLFGDWEKGNDNATH